ncbi:hypothetical protein [Streptomyces sp. cg35]|uniref:DUF7873 family protein n=1 Tax=Streptomyces sp. cg35 TaxID=3421650 RepID=UPI003D16BD05
MLAAVMGVSTRLNQIIAVEKGVKAKAHQDLTAAHHGLQKTALLAGIARTYQPKDEEVAEHRVAHALADDPRPVRLLPGELHRLLHLLHPARRAVVHRQDAGP